MPQVFQRRLERPFTVDAVRQMRQDHLAACEAAGIFKPLSWELVSMADELASNVMEHGRANWLEVRVEKEGEQVALHVEDDGKEFNTVAEAVKRGDDLVTGTERGVGLFLVHRLSREMTYERMDPGKNQLVVTPGRRYQRLGSGGGPWKN